MINKIAVAATLVIIALFTILAWAALHYYGRYSGETMKNTALIQENQTAERVVKNQEMLVNIFNTLAGATLNEQAKNTKAGQDREVAIKTVIQTEPCAGVIVPAAASEVLLGHYSQLRESTVHYDTGQPAVTVAPVQSGK